MIRHCSILFICTFLISCVSEQSYVDQGQQIKSLQFNKEEATKVRLKLALSYLQSGNFSQAKFNLDRALDYSPNKSEVHSVRGLYFERIGSLDKALSSYQKAFDLEPSSASSQHNYGSFLCKLGHYKKAKKLLNLAVESPTYSQPGRSYLNLAYCNLEQGNYYQALAYLIDANKHEPSASDILLMLASLNYALLDYESALSWYAKYKTLVKPTASGLMLGLFIYQELGLTDEIELNKAEIVRNHSTSYEARLMSLDLLEQHEHWLLRNRINLNQNYE